MSSSCVGFEGIESAMPSLGTAVEGSKSGIKGGLDSKDAITGLLAEAFTGFNEITVSTTRIHSATLCCSVSTGCCNPKCTLMGNNHDGEVAPNFLFSVEEEIHSYTLNFSAVGISRKLRSIDKFNFCASVAPTFSQLYPHLTVDTVLVASVGMATAFSTGINLWMQTLDIFGHLDIFVLTFIG